ncbi:MAG: proline dehydrogenase family protein [Pirellulales bacterium]
MDKCVNVERLLEAFTSDDRSPYTAAAQKAVFLARLLQQRANELQTPQERRQQAELDRMIHSSHDRATLVQMTDQAFRSEIPQRAADQLIHILDAQGIPRFFSPLDRTLLKGFQSFGSYLPGVAVPLVKDKMHHETANVVLPAEHDLLGQHLARRRDEGVRMNVNYLGEALLGEADAQRRLQYYLQAMQLPEIEVISVKISTIYSQISSLAREHTVTVLSQRLELLFRAAAKERFVRADGTEVAKFVYLDMEEYRDMSITAEAFMRTLDRPGLENVSIGIALQAYIPDSFAVQQEINAWARRRVAAGGAPVTIRIVKGANMEMERVEASLHGWPQAPFKTKAETDANYKRVLQLGMAPDTVKAVRLGIASHNLFDLSYGLVLAVENNAIDCVQFEMLEGMANHQRRAVFELVRNLLLYSPACGKSDFIHAIGYLIRRLDENSGPENFLRHAFRLQVDSDDWRKLEEGFLKSFDKLEGLPKAARRTQNRTVPPRAAIGDADPWPQFVNEPHTDFSLPHNVDWAERIITDWKPRCGNRAEAIPLVVAGEEISVERKTRECLDPSRPGITVGRYCPATSDDIERAVATARADDDDWRTLTHRQRSNVLKDVAQEIRLARAELIGAALADGGKTLLESDPEVSEAVDFVEFYRRTADYFYDLDGVTAEPAGVVAVISPWNFPIAIPCGGISAALAAGNTVILKPASDAVLAAYKLCQCFWRGGVSKKSLQFVPCSGASEGQRLVTHEEVDAVILTGGTETALAILQCKPSTNLFAETGGKNATIVTALSDRDQAIKHVVHSAFSHSGQKCSATSLLILEEEVYDDENFRRALCDAVESIPVGSAWDWKHRMGPLIRPPSGALERGLKELEPGESWAVIPRRDEHNPNLYSPGIKWDVRPGSFTLNTEFFGPLLAVIKARNLRDAIEITNSTGFGLTSGLQSLDQREQESWAESILAGNLYINRETTGAIVLRQPFGGLGKSAFGPGIKAGGPNYVAQLMRFTTPLRFDSSHTAGHDELTDPLLAAFIDRLLDPRSPSSEIPRDQIDAVITAINSYDHSIREEFSVVHDHFRLLGQDNRRRYVPIREMRIRIHPEDTFFEIVARIAAAKTAGCRVTVSAPPDVQTPWLRQLDEWTGEWAGAIEFVEESDAVLAETLRSHQTDRIRYANRPRVATVVREAVAKCGRYVADQPVSSHGRVELLWYVTEQSISHDYHRYGNLGARTAEIRTSPA